MYDRELVEEILRHKEFITSTGELEKRKRERVKLELISTMESFLKDFIHEIDDGEYLEKLVEDLLQGKTNPHSATVEITSRFANDVCRVQGGSKTDKKTAS